MKQNFNTFFSKHIAFDPIDPLADGLGDEIQKEQSEPEAIHLDDREYDDIQPFWSAMSDDIHSGNVIDFSDD